MKTVKTGYFDRYTLAGLSQGNLAGYLNDPYSVGGYYTSAVGNVLSRRDDILITEGGGGPRAVELYMRLFYDSQVYGAWEKFVDEIVQRAWAVTPASTSIKDEEIAEFVRQVITKLGTNMKHTAGKDLVVGGDSGFNYFIRGMSESLITGIACGEPVWTMHGDYIVPAAVRIRDPRRFQFRINELDGAVQPMLVSTDSPYEGFPIPARSMIIHRHWTQANFMDPWGAGLGRQLYPLVEFRRTMLNYWLQYADKHTSPTAIGTYEIGTPPEEVDNLFNSLQHLGQETVLVKPSGMDVTMLESRGNPSVYTDLTSYLDRQISYIINGEATVGQDTSQGSMARDKLSDSVRIRKAKAFNDALEDTINNTLIRWIVELNYGPEYQLPRIKRDFSDLEQRADPGAFISMFSMIKQLGYTVNDIDWLREKLEIPSLSLDPQMAQQQMAMGGEEPEEDDTVINSEKNAEMSEYTVSMKELAEDLDVPLVDLQQAVGLSAPDDTMTIPEVAELLGMDVRDLIACMSGADKIQTFEEGEGEGEGGGLEDMLAGLMGGDDPTQDQGSTDEVEDQMVTTKERINEKLSQGFAGKKQKLGYEDIIRDVYQGEDNYSNISVTDYTTVGEILAAVGATIDRCEGRMGVNNVVTDKEYNEMKYLKERYNQHIEMNNRQMYQPREDLLNLLDLAKMFENNLFEVNIYEESYWGLFKPYLMDLV